MNELQRREQTAERAAQYLAMTPEEHVRRSCELLAASRRATDRQYMATLALVHAQLATAKGGVRS